MKPVGQISVPVVNYKGDPWGDLSLFSAAHEMVATSVKIAKRRISFLDNHQVNRITLKSMVHWKIPSGVEADISAVAPNSVPRRRR